MTRTCRVCGAPATARLLVPDPKYLEPGASVFIVTEVLECDACWAEFCTPPSAALCAHLVPRHACELCA